MNELMELRLEKALSNVMGMMVSGKIGNKAFKHSLMQVNRCLDSENEDVEHLAHGLMILALEYSEQLDKFNSKMVDEMANIFYDSFAEIYDIDEVLYDHEGNVVENPWGQPSIVITVL